MMKELLHSIASQYTLHAFQHTQKYSEYTAYDVNLLRSFWLLYPHISIYTNTKRAFLWLLILLIIFHHFNIQ